ncbi:DUF6943 family protein [Riemerella columbina]|uniref:DUF6943 family protein n=1 Tax=Riemerella columbina TaxID=103810 RepID=UPI00037A9913|nr:hypothetical protein [Riemerella columbina]
MTIKTYNGNISQPLKEENIFYIQSHGLHAGRPLKKPIANCWEIRTKLSFAFEILTIVFESRILETFLLGSVIPFLRLEDYKKIITPILNNAYNDDKINQKYLQLEKIEKQLKIGEQTHSILKELKRTICLQAMKEIKEKTPL